MWPLVVMARLISKQEKKLFIVEFLKQVTGRRASKCSAVIHLRPTKAGDLFPVPLGR